MEPSGTSPPSDYERAVEEAPDEEDSGPGVDPADYPFPCHEPGCNRNFKSEAALRGHLRWHIKPKEPANAPATSSTGDPEKEFLRGEIERLSLETKRLRLTKEAEKYTPPEKKHDGPTAFSLTDLEMAELLEQKKLAVMDTRQGKVQNVGPDPQLTAMQEKLDKLEAANEKLREDLRQKELDTIKAEISSLKEMLSKRDGYSGNVQVELLKSVDNRLDKFGEQIRPLTSAISAYLMPSGSTVNLPAGADQTVAPSALEQQLKARGLIQ